MASPQGKPKERYTKISHEEVTKRIHETTEEVMVVDASKQWKSDNKWQLITLKIKYAAPIAYLFICFPLACFLLYRRLSIPTNDITSAVGVIMTLSFISLSNPIADIMPITGGQTCVSSLFTPTSIGYWNGTKVGCYCADTETFTSEACVFLDPNDPNYKTCTTLPANEQIDTFTWNGDRFCVRRLGDFVRTAGACPSGYTKCGLNFCTPSTDSCPISDIKILDATDPTPSGYVARPLTLEKKLVFYTDYLLDKHLVQFTFSSYKPCLDKHSFTPRSNGLVWPLEIQSHTGCGTYDIDSESIVIDSMTEHQFMTANYIMEVVENLPEYLTVTNNTDINLSSRYRFSAKQTGVCAKVTMNDVTNLIPDLDNFALVYFGISVSAMFWCGITTFIGIVYIKVAEKQELYIMDKEEPFATRFIAIVNFLQMVYWVSCFILGNNAFLKFSPTKSYLSELNDSSCFTQTNINTAIAELVNFISGKTDAFIFVTQLAMILGIVSVILWISNFLFRVAKKYEKKRF